MNKPTFVTDLTEWNNVAPKGATHYDPGGDCDVASFMQYDDVNDEWLFWDDIHPYGGCWELYGALPGSDLIKELEARCYPKPSVESDLVIGEVYDVTDHTGYYSGKAKLLGTYKNFYWLVFLDSDTPFCCLDQDVTLTKSDPKREKWVQAAVEIMQNKHPLNEWQVAEIIYDAGLAKDIEDDA